MSSESHTASPGTIAIQCAKDIPQRNENKKKKITEKKILNKTGRQQIR